ncbi:MAG: transposase [Magnetococcales bacterium]|nr:transposase [Magnetococcales bacterium]
MFRPIDKQTSMDELHFWMPDESRERLKRTWPEIFRTQIMRIIPEDAFASLYHAFQGRPNFPVAILVGLSILKEMLDLTDEALMDSFRFDMRFHYALGLRLEETELAIRTLYNFRSRMVGSPAVAATFERVTDQIITILGLNTGEQRLDSSHIRSNMANLARLGLFIKTIEHFLASLKKSFPDRFEALPKAFKERYGERPGHFGDVRGTQSQRRLNVVAKDLWSLVNRFRADEDVKKMRAYKLLERLLDEQCVVATDDQETPVAVKESKGVVLDQPQNSDDQKGATGSGDADNAPVALKKSEEILSEQSKNPDDQQSTNDHAYEDNAPVTLKKPKEVASNTLQSPSDPDATYSGHKGKGYQIQICETCHKDNAIQVITCAFVEPAHVSDQKATIPVIDALDKRGIKPTRLFADTNYNSGQNLLDAAARGVDLMAPTPGQASTNIIQLCDFNIDYVEFDLQSCPKGFRPVKDTLGADGMTHNLQFDHTQCAACDMSSVCVVGTQKGRLRFHPTDIVLATAINYSRHREGTEAFKEAYKTRAGIESTNAEGKTAHGMAKFWTRKLPRMMFAGAMKALAINVKRFMRYQCAQILEIAGKMAVVPV